jgi:hypothetical protein
MSRDDRPDLEALAQLEQVVDQLRDALAEWRRRALKAESERVELSGGSDVVALRERILELEADSSEQRRRLTAARERLAGLVARLRFLEEQVAIESQQR